MKKDKNTVRMEIDIAMWKVTNISICNSTCEETTSYAAHYATWDTLTDVSWIATADSIDDFLKKYER